MPHERKQRRRTPDLEEITPNRFLIHNTRALPTLKGEGTIEGRIFELKTWRRDGLLARLRQHGLYVLAIIDRIHELPGVPYPSPIGPVSWHPLANALDRFSYFDPILLRWAPIEPEQHNGTPAVAIHAGWALRRRKGRGRASYYQAMLERSGEIGLRGIDETAAVLIGYAQANQLDDRPLLVERRGDSLLLPTIELPPAYQEVLRIMMTPSEEGPLVEQIAWPLVQGLFGRLGLHLREDMV